MNDIFIFLLGSAAGFFFACAGIVAKDKEAEKTGQVKINGTWYKIKRIKEYKDNE